MKKTIELTEDEIIMIVKALTELSTMFRYLYHDITEADKIYNLACNIGRMKNEN